MSDTTAVRNRIFISYRREDAEHVAGRLADDLREDFPAKDQVFDDINQIAPGVDFGQALRLALDASAAVLVIIGPKWSRAVDRNGRRRLELETDWVRREVAASLARPDVAVFPLTIEATEMPSPEDLPEPLRPLTDRNALRLTNRHWHPDVTALVGSLRKVPALQTQAEPAGLRAQPQGPVESPVVVPPPTRPQPPMPRPAPGWERDEHFYSPKPTGTSPTLVGSTRSGSLRWIIAGALAFVLFASYWALRSGVQPPSPTPIPTLASPIPASGPSPTPTPPLAAGHGEDRRTGEVFRDCADCPEMVVVPAGEFSMGSPENEPGRPTDEWPQHRVAIRRAFAVCKYEITFAEWDACVAAGGCTHKAADQGWGRGRRPVTHVSWEDAQEYVSWLAKQTGKPYRLLSEAEWEYAARGGRATRYPWGDEPGTRHGNFDGSGSQWSRKRTAPVGSFPANGSGLHDMIGNVWEWVQDCWHDGYEGAPADGRVFEGGNCGRRVLRGGSWHSGPEIARVAFRFDDAPGNRDSFSGFRVARTF